MLIDAVIHAIETYLAGHPSRSLRNLSRRSGVSYSTIRRLMQREVMQPSIENTVVPILSVFMSSQNVAAVIKEYGGSLATMWDQNKRTFQQSQGIDWEDIDYQIILEARRSEGVTREAICSRYGKLIGAPRLEYLLDQGVLRLDNGNYFASSDFELDPSPISILKKIRAIAKNFDTQHLGKGAFFDYFAGSVSQDGLERIRTAARRFVAVLEEEGAKDVSQDNEIMVSIGLVADFLENEDKAP
ncbi:hypothetical protein [Pseudobacteriovorax antillogorgiicola]|uniref:Uncharacterized protein n=1 Tax=Pseudobacteriovorax antillogorgiicola TaxID=1513793 RepID=A0A1Y6CEB6_9BACT|nr:hypothetical protein [Pseudobacteriovorax antillogorgiicola]TCS47648.1 hypothetical protein EDD56_12089 [Pseudobacteriovorax antillogorgiicola]SMF59847.1 hypothetical protein SAMN06296036_12051 [Pseudobacteriovorax antillogorgiicola]